MMPGGPDVVFHMTEEPVDVPAEGTVEYRYYVVDTNFKEDKWVKVAECMPDNRGVVHHMIVFLKPPGMGLFGGNRQAGDNPAEKPGEGDAAKADAKPQASARTPPARPARAKSPSQARPPTRASAAVAGGGVAGEAAATRPRSASCAASRRARGPTSCPTAWPS